MSIAPLNTTTLCMPYYENPNMLEMQLRKMSELPADIRGAFKLILVDDGSTRTPAQPVVERARPGGLKLSLYRMDIDLRWGQDVCRNVAASQADAEWLLMTDIDHIVPEPTWERVLFHPLDKNTAYGFERRSGPNVSPRHSHQNSWLLTRAMFDACGGYDERFAGWYGTDGDFQRRLRQFAEFRVLREHLVEITPDMVEDANTRHYTRKTREDNEAIARIKAERAKSQHPEPLRGTFPWHRIF